MKRSNRPRFRRGVNPTHVTLLLVLAAACEAEPTSSSGRSSQDAGSRTGNDAAAPASGDVRTTDAGLHSGADTEGQGMTPTHGTTDTAESNDPKPGTNSDDDPATSGSPTQTASEPSSPGVTTPPPASCDADGGDATVSAPTLLATLSARWHEAWLASPAVADLDEDGVAEILVARDELLLAWHLDNTVVFTVETGGRIWAPPVVADLLPDVPGLEVAAAAREKIYVWDAHGTLQPGFPTTWRDEVRALAAGDIDNDGALELVAVTTRELVTAGQADILVAYELNGEVVSGFPPNTSGTSGCGATCYVHGGFDQTLALGDLNGDGAADIFAPQDNAYVSLHRGDGFAFDANALFEDAPKVNGVRFLHDLEEAKQGHSEHEDTSLQAHFTNSAPAIADLDGDGHNDLVVLGSVQNASQSEREHGVALWAFRPDGTRLDAWQNPLHVPEYLAGLWDYEDTNVVAATNQVSVADITPESPGLEIVFAGFDGQIHAASATAELLWSHRYTSDDRVLTGGVVIADLSADGSPEIVFNTYSPDNDKGQLVILDAAGDELHSIALPERGAMPVPTVADVDGNGNLEIVVSLKDGVDRERQVLVYSVASSKPNCMPWPTGRGNLLRTGFVH